MNPFEQGLRRYLQPEQIEKIQRTKVGIAGAGGLGSNCAQMLVRSGFRNLVIADFDVIDYSNLNRQFFFLHQAGELKAKTLRENLQQINPAVNIEIIREQVRPDNVGSLFAGCDVVVEAFDRAECKKMIVETYINSGKLLVAASGLAGWGDSDNIKVHRVKDNFYLVGDLVSGISPNLPPLAPRVMIAAAKQADIVLSYVLDGTY